MIYQIFAAASGLLGGDQVNHWFFFFCFQSPTSALGGTILSVYSSCHDISTPVSSFHVHVSNRFSTMFDTRWFRSSVFPFFLQTSPSFWYKLFFCQIWFQMCAPHTGAMILSTNPRKTANPLICKEIISFLRVTDTLNTSSIFSWEITFKMPVVLVLTYF